MGMVGRAHGFVYNFVFMALVGIETVEIDTVCRLPMKPWLCERRQDLFESKYYATSATICNKSYVQQLIVTVLL